MIKLTQQTKHRMRCGRKGRYHNTGKQGKRYQIRDLQRSFSPNSKSAQGPSVDYMHDNGGTHTCGGDPRQPDKLLYIFCGFCEARISRHVIPFLGRGEPRRRRRRRKGRSRSRSGGGRSGGKGRISHLGDEPAFLIDIAHSATSIQRRISLSEAALDVQNLLIDITYKARFLGASGFERRAARLGQSMVHTRRGNRRGRR